MIEVSIVNLWVIVIELVILYVYGVLVTVRLCKLHHSFNSEVSKNPRGEKNNGSSDMENTSQVIDRNAYSPTNKNNDQT